MAQVGDLVLAPIREAIDRCAIPSAAATVTLRLGVLGKNAEVVGGIAMASSLHGTTVTG
jgi:hypothetical protein